MFTDEIMAELTDIKRRIDNEERNIGLDDLQKLADAFDVLNERIAKGDTDAMRTKSLIEGRAPNAIERESVIYRAREAWSGPGMRRDCTNDECGLPYSSVFDTCPHCVRRG